jgi:hypothetical protein
MQGLIDIEIADYHLATQLTGYISYVSFNSATAAIRVENSFSSLAQIIPCNFDLGNIFLKLEHS